jgi:predicted 3-demethylubiquinone-9 3-methyltransferase (glyoxalase superfamily)
MMTKLIVPCLWFDNQAEEAVSFYTSVFKNSRINSISRYGKEGYEIHRQEEGTVMVVGFELNGQSYTALNGGPLFKFNESVSFQVYCENQEEIDYYWDKLTEGGEESYCGWLKDKYGLSWQVVPSVLSELMSDATKAGKVTNAFMQMRKFDIAKLIEAAGTSI